jgi:ribosomal protein S18 acetylase RimI-like enzyme
VALTRDDYQAVARLHINNLDQSFLATLGERFLSEMYRAIDRADDCALIIERNENGEVIGFVTGGRSMGPIYKAMLPRVLIWGWSLALRLCSPKRIKRVFDILRYDGEGDFDTTSAELFSIAVDRGGRGKGVAPKLFSNLIDYFKARNIEAFRIIVGKNLGPAHGFYTKMGAQVAGELEVHPGETSTVYIYSNTNT